MKLRTFRLLASVVFVFMISAMTVPAAVYAENEAIESEQAAGYDENYEQADITPADEDLESADEDYDLQEEDWQMEDEEAFDENEEDMMTDGKTGE